MTAKVVVPIKDETRLKLHHSAGFPEGYTSIAVDIWDSKHAFEFIGAAADTSCMMPRLSDGLTFYIYKNGVLEKADIDNVELILDHHQYLCLSIDDACLFAERLMAYWGGSQEISYVPLTHPEHKGLLELVRKNAPLVRTLVHTRHRQPYDFNKYGTDNASEMWVPMYWSSLIKPEIP